MKYGKGPRKRESVGLLRLQLKIIQEIHAKADYSNFPKIKQNSYGFQGH